MKGRIVAEKKARIRKAPTDVKQVETSQSRPEASAQLPKLSIFSFLRSILRPFRWLIPRYFVNSWREVRQVTWPNRRETWRLTLAVFIFAIVFGALIAGVDKVLDLLFKKVILKQ